MTKGYSIDRLTKEEWASLSATAHLAVFNMRVPFGFERIDFALVIKDETGLCGYLTARELDSNTCYWQYGGAFPGTHSTVKAYACYEHFIRYFKERYKQVTTLVENSNVRYLKLAMHLGFRIIGCRFVDGTVLVELLNDFSLGASE